MKIIAENQYVSLIIDIDDDTKQSELEAIFEDSDNLKDFVNRIAFSLGINEIIETNNHFEFDEPIVDDY